jgi:hypothetical protein
VLCNWLLPSQPSESISVHIAETEREIVEVVKERLATGRVGRSHDRGLVAAEKGAAVGARPGAGAAGLAAARVPAAGRTLGRPLGSKETGRTSP